MKDITRVQSIDRAVAILDCFSEEKKELKLSEISERLGLNKSTVHGIISTLKYHGFISQDEETQKYKLGIRFVQFGDLVINSMNIRNAAVPVIDAVCEKIEETVHVAMLDGLDVVWIEKRECTKSIKTSTKIGARLPAYTTADGKIIICYQNKDKIKNYLPKRIPQYTNNTITNKGEFIKKLEEMKKNGYAIDNEEYVEGLKCVAAPIFDHDGKVRFSLSTTGPAFRMNEERIKELIVIIKEAANEISQRIGYMK
ncbi:MAG TPA: IclR family transcriptional regulator [Sedimentibacter sp.]|jgi:DNA-binding IclR family transcriptional regulator|nr:IclR family transcriptional regulator [Sedimentibacter sp.]HOG63446.1 IclR family transcriptional regulator [Sedimentibacter sp.]HPY55907.1 IclR family transcriptional regulator [Sedimentibacter sp.]HQC69400.1 IclR family transcriptional regulator [Sedimentibacter sp.]